MGFKRIVAAAIALAVLVGGLTLFLIFTQVTTLTEARGWVEHTRQVIQSNQQLVASLQQAETRVGALQGQLEYEFGHHKVLENGFNAQGFE